MAVLSWIVAATIQGGKITIDTLGTNEVMLSGNLVAILTSGLIHYIWSMFIDPQDYDFAELDKHITLVEQDLRGLTDEEKDPVLLYKTERWIKRRGYVLTILLIVVWPLLSVPAGVFSKSYFAFWVLIAIMWGFAAAITLFILPVSESTEDLGQIVNGIFKAITGSSLFEDEDVVPAELTAKKDEDEASSDVKKLSDDDGEA